MQNETNKSQTAKRIYWTAFYGGIWSANFRPINAKTGKPWQSCHKIILGADTVKTSPSGITYTGFSSEALALAAIDKMKLME
jgi:hypothetical protein